MSGVHVTQAAWAQVPGPVRDTIISATLDQVGHTVGSAVTAGGFSRENARASRVGLTLDCDGFAQLSAAVTDFNERAAEIERESVRRIAEGVEASGRRDDKAAIDAQLVTMLFDSGASGVS